jgi:hypothetical protein
MDPESKWITEYENKEKIYTNFNKEKVSIIKIYYIYLDYEKKIYNIKTDKEYIENNEFTCERQIYLIKKFQYNIEKKHKLIGMLEYKININSDEIDDIINYKKYAGNLSSIRYMREIKFDNTISLLQDMNSVYFIFSDTISDIDENTKGEIKKNKNNLTKRIVLTSEKHKKTKRK